MNLDLVSARNKQLLSTFEAQFTDISLGAKSFHAIDSILLVRVRRSRAPATCNKTFSHAPYW
jgi:hypothetical protein